MHRVRSLRGFRCYASSTTLGLACGVVSANKASTSCPGAPSSLVGFRSMMDLHFVAHTSARHAATEVCSAAAKEGWRAVVGKGWAWNDCAIETQAISKWSREL